MTVKGLELHPGQIPTERSVISSELFGRGPPAIKSLCRCITDGPESPEYMNHLVAAAMQFERISCQSFRDSEECFRKPNKRVYTREIFESWAETPTYNCRFAGKMIQSNAQQTCINAKRRIKNVRFWPDRSP